MKIAGLLRLTLIDFPDLLAATVFLAGCNLNCGYCHNRWMIYEADVTPTMAMADLVTWLEGRRGLLDGVCVSGGEPTLQPDLPDLLAAIKRLGFQVKLDTNGTRPDAIETLLAEGLLDYVAMDLKAPLDFRYAAIAGCSVHLPDIHRSMAALRGSGISYEFRTTVAPSLRENDLVDVGSTLSAEERWYLQPFLWAEGIPIALAKQSCMGEQDLREVAQRLAEQTPGIRVRAG